jgi:hypothetical protein
MPLKGPDMDSCAEVKTVRRFSLIYKVVENETGIYALVTSWLAVVVGGSGM